MGTMHHHAIVVTSAGYGTHAKEAHAKAVAIFGVDGVSALGTKLVNGIQTFCVWPDGSKEGWPESADGDGHRATFVDWLNRQRYCDGSTPFSWVEIEYGECGVDIVHHFDEVETGDEYAGPTDLETSTGDRSKANR